MIEEAKRKHTYRIFLSYVAADRVYADRVRSILSKRADLHVVSIEIGDGEKTQSRLNKELDKCDIFVVILSPKSLESPWVIRKLGYAWGILRATIPVLTQPNLKLPVSWAGMECFEIEELQNPGTLDRVLDVYEGVR
jgi:hypothetical protein